MPHIHENDLNELRRMATNTYDDDKRFLNRVLTGIAMMEREIRAVTNENEALRKAASDATVES